MKGMLFDIQKFCTQDGPGIRTTVFLKGCPLHCAWCHNPESQEGQKEKMCAPEEVVGYEMSTEEILEVVLEDKAFYDNSGGGVTLSGGEPLFQKQFCLEFLKKAKEAGLHICMETCGFASKELIREAANYVDVFLFDYKETDEKKHREYTGVGNEEIVSNLKLLDKIGKKIILRCPIVPSYNDSTEHFGGIAEVANRLQHIEEIQIEPYHNFGAEKYKRLGRSYELLEIKPPADEMVHRWMDEIRKRTTVKIRRL